MKGFQRRFRGLAVLMMLALLPVAPAFGQVTTGDITGRILDPQGNAVAGATITARNVGTEQTRIGQIER